MGPFAWEGRQHHQSQTAIYPPPPRGPVWLCAFKAPETNRNPRAIPGRFPGQGSAQRALGPLQLPRVHHGRGSVGPSLQGNATCGVWQSRSVGPPSHPLRTAAIAVMGRPRQHVPVTWRLPCPGPRLPVGLSVSSQASPLGLEHRPYLPPTHKAPPFPTVPTCTHANRGFGLSGGKAWPQERAAGQHE